MIKVSLLSKFFIVVACGAFVILTSHEIYALSSADYRLNDLTIGSTANASGSTDYAITKDATDQVFIYTPPVATLLGTPSDPTFQNTAAITVGGEAVTQYRYRLDGGALSVADVVSNTLNLSGLSAGPHTLEVFGGDAPGNFQAVATIFTWTVNIAGGEGGGGSGVPLNEDSTLFAYLAPPTVNTFERPTFKKLVELFGERPENADLYVNNQTIGVNLPTPLTWVSERLVNLGINRFHVYARQNNVSSETVTTEVSRCQIGDTNCDGRVDDFDLAGVSANWLTDWWPGDFNEDGRIDDFDLAGLVTYWSFFH